MSLLTTLLVLSLLLPVCRRLFLLWQTDAEKTALRLYRRAAWLLGGTILTAMAMQEVILLLAGQLSWATGLPLHLCSLMGILTLPALLTRRDTLLSALLYAGMPGAALALVFPAVADTPWPRLTGFLFCLMHAGIAFSPLLPLSLGWRPRPLGAMKAGLLLLGAGAAASAANGLTGGNYLFLAGPVTGTPLMLLGGGSSVVYRLLLAALAILLLSGEAAIVFLLTGITQKSLSESGN